jgi:hypothetical protein
MPLDPVLAQGIAPINFAGPDPATKMNQLAMMMKMQGLQSEGQLNALKLTETQREMADVEAMREAIRTGADFRDPKIASQYGAKGLAMNKALIDADSADLDRKTKIATAGRDIWSRISDQTSYEAALPELEALRPGSTANLPPVFDQKLVAQNVMDAKTFLDQYKPDDFERRVIAAGYAKGSPEYTRLMQQKVNLDTTRAPTDASQLPADVRTVNWLMTQPKNVQDMYFKMSGKGDTGKVAQVITDNAGNVRMFTASGEEVIPKTAEGAPPPKGKPSATFEKTAAQRKQLTLDLDRAIAELSAAAEDGGLIDQSTGSGLGQLADTAAGAIGQATSGALAISELQPVADLVLKLVPRFEGPQSDKDTQSYEKAAGQIANGNLPTAIRKTAARKIVRLMTERKGQFVSRAMADEGTSARETAAGASSEDDPVARAAKLLDKYPGK